MHDGEMGQGDAGTQGPNRTDELTDRGENKDLSRQLVITNRTQVKSKKDGKTDKRRQ